MPELPEVETTRRGIAPYLEGRRIRSARVRQPRLRWPVATDLGSLVGGQKILSVSRRGKYLLLHLEGGTVILHLGMSGSLRVLAPETPPDRHDHVDLILENGLCLRLRDPRRFGALLWTQGDPLRHPLLRTLGPEPLGAAFNGEWLYHHARGRRAAVKAYLMNSHIVVGVGNIYANEALFVAGIHPARQAGRISLRRYRRLADAVQQILARAIAAGGTTLRDFVNNDGRPGYFGQHLLVYGRDGEPCEVCGRSLRRRVIGQRSSYYCAHCQA